MIGEFQALQHYVADIAMWQKQGELMLLDGARLQSVGQPCANASNMAKVLCSEYAGRAADLGIQILGGMGYSAETDMQRYWRDARLLRIGPISNEMARNMIAEGLVLLQHNIVVFSVRVMLVRKAPCAGNGRRPWQARQRGGRASRERPSGWPVSAPGQRCTSWQGLRPLPARRALPGTLTGQLNMTILC